MNSNSFQQIGGSKSCQFLVTFAIFMELNTTYGTLEQGKLQIFCRSTKAQDPSLLWIKTWHDHCNSKRKWKEFGVVVKMFQKTAKKCFKNSHKVWILFSLFRQLLVRLKKSFSSRQRGYQPQFSNGLTWWRFACKHTKFELKFLK